MLPIPLSCGLKRKAKRKQIQQQDAELKRFDSLPQNPSLPNDDHNAFTNVVGNNELEGGRTLVFCTSVAALRHISSLLRILGTNIWTLHAQMQQRARLKAIDRFRGDEHGLLVATDVAARGLDIPGVQTIVHYQLPHSEEVYVHISGRTARASADGCNIALIAPNETSKFVSLCKSFSEESFQRFPMDNAYLPEVIKRLSLAHQIDKSLRKDFQAELSDPNEEKLVLGLYLSPND
ncbi:hypothetical protein ACE6H2_001791 [Prunus campanulata]